jgi:hypothetical protein
MVIYKPFTNELGDMLILTLKFKEDIEFKKGIIIKLKPGKFTLETELISAVGTLDTNTF